MRKTLSNKGLKVYLIGKDKMRYELWDLVEDKSHCLSYFRYWVIYELKESKEILSYHSDDILLRWTINDCSHSNHSYIPITPVLTTKLGIDIRVHCWDHLSTDSSCNIFKCVACSNRDTVLRHIINILVVSILVKFVQTSDHYLKHALEAILNNALSWLPNSQPTLLYLRNSWPDFDR